MLTIVTLWTLMIWAEPIASSSAMTVATIPGFASESSCLKARERIVMENAARSGGRRSGQTGIAVTALSLDGNPVPLGDLRPARLLWRARADLRRAFPNPYDPTGLLHWIATQEPAILGRDPAG
jgi:hypothetical protein